MKYIASRLTCLLIPLILAACGTFEVVLLPTPTLTAPSTDVPVQIIPTPFPPSACPPFLNETVLPDNPDDPQNYIGHHYDELNMPEGLIFNGGWVLTDNLITEWVSRPDFDMQFLAQTICWDVNGKPYNTVVDAVKIPKLQDGYGRADACSPDPVAGPVIVFGKFDITQPDAMLLGILGWPMYDLDFGIQINLQSRRFEPLSLKQLECVHSSGMGS